VFEPDPAVVPAPRHDPEDPRFLELFTDGPGDVHLAGVPYDVSVLGRKGCRAGPTGIREAMRFLSNHDPRDDTDLIGLRVQDHGNVAGLDDLGDDVLAAHDQVTAAVRPLFEAGGPVVMLGGDHGLTFAHVRALAEARPGRIGIVVIDAHYDLRTYEGQPSSGTPFRRILEELGGRVRPRNLVEVGIRPYANTRQLAAYAAEAGMPVIHADEVRARGVADVLGEVLERTARGVNHLWLSVDIDGLDQSIASGCSAPGAGGLTYPEVEAIVRAVAGHPLCRGMDVMEVAPGLDPTGNTCRTAAQLVASFVGATRSRD